MNFQLQFQSAPTGPGWLISLSASGDFLMVNPAEVGLGRFMSPYCGPATAHLTYLGHWANQPVWMCEAGGKALEAVSLRSLADLLTPAEFALGARAMQLLHWRHMHRFCGRCGTATELSSTELCCQCPSCGASFYPRISPCVIGLVSRGDELLLACHHRHKAGRYSLLAGFIEAGESAEEAFAREVFEEVGIGIQQIRYWASQPWPYPSQLMLGFFADYASGEISPDSSEIAHAAWFHPNHLPDIPSGFSIAGKLIRAFLQQRGYHSAAEG